MESRLRLYGQVVRLSVDVGQWVVEGPVVNGGLLNEVVDFEEGGGA